jgi:hypothetical protein
MLEPWSVMQSLGNMNKLDRIIGQKAAENHGRPDKAVSSTYLYIIEERGIALLFSKISSYFPYFSFPYRSIHRKIIPAEFHKITGIKFNSTP